MAVFLDTIKVLNRVNKVEGTLTTIVDKISDLLDKLFSAILTMTQLLKKAIAALIVIKGFIENTATALKNNPLAKGPWAVVFKIAASILMGVAKIIEGIIALLRALQKASRSSVLKKLQKAIDKVDDIFIAYGEIAGKVEKHVNKLLALCHLLEKQQKKIELANPGLRKSVNSNLLKPLDKLLDVVEPKAVALAKKITGLEKKLNELKKIAALLNGLEKLANVLKGVIGNFVAMVKALFGVIKALIFSIPLIGWLLDKLDELISWAIKASGIEAALNALVNKMKQLPFIKILSEFAAMLKAFIEELLASVEAIEKEIESIIKQFKDVLAFIDKILDRFKKLALNKKKVEKDLVPRVTAMKERLNESIQMIESDDFDGFSIALSEYEGFLWLAHDQMFDGAVAMFGIEVYRTFNVYCTETLDYLLVAEQYLENAIPASEFLGIHQRHIKATEKLLDIALEFKQSEINLDDEYFIEIAQAIYEIERLELSV